MIYNNIIIINQIFPYDIYLHIIFFIKTSYINTIIKCWKRYYFYKKFIYNSILLLPKIHSIINNDYIFNVTNIKTLFYFKKLNSIITGNESYFNSIHLIYYNLAISVDDYEWVSGINNTCYSFNKYYCLYTAIKYNWGDIIDLLT